MTINELTIILVSGAFLKCFSICVSESNNDRCYQLCNLPSLKKAQWCSGKATGLVNQGLWV